MAAHATVGTFLDQLEPTDRELVETLLTVVRSVDPGLTEHIKWNSPSYVFQGEDRFTVSARPGRPVRLVLHAGATTREDRAGAPRFSDTTGLLEWHSDIRASIVFRTPADVTACRDDLRSVLARWLEPPVR